MANQEVGYKNPPKEHRFEPGKSGNPAGRPKGLPSMRKTIEAELAKRVMITEDGIEYPASKQVALVKNLVDAALSGNQRAASTVFAIFEKDRNDDQHAGDETDDLLLQDFIEREVQLRLKAHGDSEEGPK
jgi:hypothetical protein